ncbi:MAG TPA: DivIVA domain-containing protein [bacterium]|nr:DivIVA domain-containing protein [bacterium]
MKIGPVDIRNHTFQKKMRGIDDVEVRAYLDLVADRLEESIQEAIQLREAAERTAQDIREYKAMEKALRDSLVAAERITEERLGVAEREARLIVKNAEVEAEKIVAHAREWSARYRAELEDLRRQRTTFLERFRALILSQSKILEASAKEFLAIDSRPTLPAELSSLREEPPTWEQAASFREMPLKDVGAKDLKTHEVKTHEVKANEVKANEVKANEVKVNEVPTFPLHREGPEATPPPSPDAPKDPQASQVAQEAAALRELQAARFAFNPASAPLTGSFVHSIPPPPPLPPQAPNAGSLPGNAPGTEEGLFIPREGTYAEGDRG